jgi:chromosome segregation ATPase
MEETKPRPGVPGDRAQIAAEKLRALRERANKELDEHRRRLTQVESELGLRVRQLSEDFDAASAGIERETPSGRDEEVAVLRRQLEEGRAKHEKFVEQLAAARRQLDAIQAQPCTACQEAAQQLADAQGEIRQLQEQLQTLERQRQEDRARHDKFTEQVAAARQAIADLQTKSGEQSAQLQIELETARAAQAAAEAQAAAATRDMEALQREYDALRQRAESLEKQHASLADEHRDALAQAEKKQARIGELEGELKSAHAANDDRRKELEAQQKAAKAVEEALKIEIETLHEKLLETEKQRTSVAVHNEELQRDKAQLETALANIQTKVEGAQQAVAAADAHQAELKRQFADAQSEQESIAGELIKAKAECGQLSDALNAAQRKIEALEQSGAALSDLDRQLEQLRLEAQSHEKVKKELESSLAQAQAQLTQFQEAACPRPELDDLQHKFNLALADVQKLKVENGKLREELATRPEADDEVSPELVALRTERDKLAARVSQLEAAASTAAGPRSQQESDDLQRRFEMAVDDVRELKQENAKLRDQLAGAKSTTSTAVSPNGSLDWAAQKARLLASLAEEEEDGPADPKRRQQRLSIEETIEATERVVAEKDREIAELRAGHDASGVKAASDAETKRQVEELLDADQVVTQERKRLAELQTQWEAKLRAAELEFSVERAKLAREQAALKEKLFELQKFDVPATGEGADAKPRRRWRSALGLGDDGDEPAKGK